MSIMSLPKECTQNVLSFLDEQDRIAAASTCHQIHGDERHIATYKANLQSVVRGAAPKTVFIRELFNRNKPEAPTYKNLWQETPNSILLANHLVTLIPTFYRSGIPPTWQVTEKIIDPRFFQETGPEGKVTLLAMSVYQVIQLFLLSSFFLGDFEASNQITYPSSYTYTGRSLFSDEHFPTQILKLKMTIAGVATTSIICPLAGYTMQKVKEAYLVKHRDVPDRTLNKTDRAITVVAKAGVRVFNSMVSAAENLFIDLVVPSFSIG